MANQRVSTMTKCLFCNKRQPSTGEKNECFVEVNGNKQLKKSFWICEQCGISEKDRTRALAGIVLAEAKSKSCDGRSKDSAVVQLVTVGESGAISLEASKQHSVVENDSGAGSCCCQACVERKHFEQEQLREVQTLQKYWVQLRHAVRQMYRDRLQRDGSTGKGKKFDLHHLSDLIQKLCARDPHQLFQRLESLGREHVMELKVHLLQILVSPEKAGVTSGSNSECIASNMSPEIAEHFLRSLLNFASQFFETVDNMKEFLAPLEKEHLEKFGITWRIVNCNLFDSVVYHDSLLQATLPSIYSRLGFKMTTDDSSEGNVSIIVDRKSTPSHVADMMKNFVELGTTLSVCRNRMETAQERMEKYLSKRMKIYKATLKAKQRILKQDLEFFKRQRRLLEEHVKKKDLKKTNSGDEDVSAFCETPDCLLSENGNRSSHEHSASTAECTRCHRSHCPCDQCSISHLIACGLTSAHDVELPDCESLSLLDDLNDSSNSSCSDSEDSDYGAEDEGVSDKRAKMDIICHKKTSIICGDGQKITKVEATILPTGLCSDYATTVVQRHMYNAYGDWEVNVDPSTLLFSDRWEEVLLSKCIKQKERASKDDDAEKATRGSKTDFETAKPKQNGQEAEKSKKPENGVVSKAANGPSETTVPSNQTTPPKVQACKRHSLTLTATTVAAKRTEAAATPVLDAAAKAAAAKAKCDVKDKKTDVRSSPRKSSLTGTPTRTTPSVNCQQQQFTQEWFKDPKNAKYAKALLGCVAGNNKDAACLKELNLDVETVRKLCTEHVAAAAVAATKGGDQTGCHANGGDAQKIKAAALLRGQRDGDSISADEDDDSWSDHSSIVSQKDKHCDCCYCEMFGHGGVDFQKPCGRDEYPQIRERLRLKLKKKGAELPSHKSEQIDGYRGFESIDNLVEYITGEKKTGRPEEPSGTAKSSAKKTKKSQAKSKKNENKKIEKQDRPPSPLPTARNGEIDHHDSVPMDDQPKEKEEQENAGQQRQAIEPPAPEKNLQQNGASSNDHDMQSEPSNRRRAAAPNDKKNLKRNSEVEDVNIDEVFKPKDIDLNSTDLDEVEREIECFKRFVMNCQPRENREKVHLNIGHLLRDKKETAAAAAVV